MTPALPAVLPIRPFTRPARGEVTLPGSKSITNRALLLAALCDAPVTLTGALFSEDTHLMAEALRRLGFTVEADERALSLRVADQAKGFPAGENPVELFVGLAGTAARFLTALCAAAPRGVYRIDGVPQMRKRPMRGLIDALRQLGADIRCTGEEGFFPLEIHARGLRGGAVEIDASESSQMLSALLMVSPLARTAVEVKLIGEVRWPFVQMTARLMEEFGQAAVRRSGEEKFIVGSGTRYRLDTGRYAIEPDATAASYFLALPLVVGGSLQLRDLRPPGAGLQGDSVFNEVLTRARSRKSGESFARDFSAFSDTFLTLAAIAPLLAGPTRITGIAHTRKQETDRVAGMARELKKLGQDVVEEHDALTITPRLEELRARTAKAPLEIETYGDHRFAMSFGILGCHDLHGDGRPWLAIRNPACCAKTFPNFFDVLGEVWRNSHST
ncbi:MAG TPA: 3-phosphoshikimate 1-carboxyvinyltransferase [Opitutaceae bacterium]|nr:3-phosphoshikimate 1-carboxyvinyltransferase [Opitutaceae bacterium]